MRNVPQYIIERILARARENAENNRALNYGADPDLTLYELGLPKRQAVRCESLSQSVDICTQK